LALLCPDCKEWRFLKYRALKATSLRFAWKSNISCLLDTSSYHALLREEWLRSAKVMSTLPGSPRPVVPKPDSSVVLPLPPPRVVPGDTADVPETFRETEKQVKGNDFF
jgi:hypothetical protein